jgi:hypothetical protein
LTLADDNGFDSSHSQIGPLGKVILKAPVPSVPVRKSGANGAGEDVKEKQVIKKIKKAM